MKRNGFNYGFNSRGHKNKHSESRRKESIKTKTEINTFKRKVELINWRRAYFKKINKRDKLLENLIAKKKKKREKTETHSLKNKKSSPGWCTSVSWTQAGNQRVASSIPSQGTCLGCGPGPQWAPPERQPHIDVSLPLFLPPLPSLKINK